MDIKEKISAIYPDASFSEQGDLLAIIPAEHFREVAEKLRYNNEDPMDYLRDIVGMDWGE